MSSETRDVLIIGAGVAGGAAAQALRDGGFTGSVLVVGAEGEEPYERPEVTKGYLSGDTPKPDALSLGEGWFAEHDVELRADVRVTALETAGRTAHLGDGTTITYDRALLATGSDPVVPPLDGADAEGVHYLRTLGDADGLKAEAAGARRAVIVGGGFIGSEAAAVLTAAHGLEVTLVLPESAPLEKVVGRQIGGFFGAKLAAGGVELVSGATVERITVEDGRTTGVALQDGRTIPADLVVLGVGAHVNTELAREAGLEVDDGGAVVVDDRLRTSADGVWAAGDIAAHPSLRDGGERIRVEHVEHARGMGTHVGEGWNGADEAFTKLPFFYCDMSDWVGFEMYGPPDAAGDELVIEGEVGGEGGFAGWYLQKGRLTGYVSVDGFGDLEKVEPLFDEEGEIDRSRLVSKAD